MATHRPPPPDHRWASMSRVGLRFGWSSHQTAKALRAARLRHPHGPSPTDAAIELGIARSSPLSVSLDYHQWHIAKTVRALVEAGYQPLAQQDYCKRLLLVSCRGFMDHAGEYFSRAGQRETARARLQVWLEQCLQNLAKLDRHAQAGVVSWVAAELQSSGAERVAVEAMFARWMKFTAQDLQAFAIESCSPLSTITQAPRARRL